MIDVRRMAVLAEEVKKLPFRKSSKRFARIKRTCDRAVRLVISVNDHAG